MQAEDEIAAIGMAIGAAFGGALGVTATSGPGICLKAEAIGLAVMTELPLRHHQRAARRAEHRPADQDRAGRPAAGDVRPQRRVPAADPRRRASPADCFDMAFEAVRLAVALHDAGDVARRTATSPTAPSRGASPTWPTCRA